MNSQIYPQPGTLSELAGHESFGYAMHAQLGLNDYYINKSARPGDAVHVAGREDRIMCHAGDVMRHVGNHCVLPANYHVLVAQHVNDRRHAPHHDVGQLVPQFRDNVAHVSPLGLARQFSQTRQHTTAGRFKQACKQFHTRKTMWDLQGL